MSVIMLAIFAVMVGIASQYPPQARFMPLVLGIPGIALCLFQLFLEIRARRRTSEPTVTGTQGDSIETGETRREIVLWAYFIGLVASLILLGFWLTIPVFLALFLRFYSRESWQFSLGVSAAGTALLFFVFHKGLAVVLHGGFITEYVLDRFVPQ